MTMTPKEYLQQIRKLDRAVTLAMRQLESLESDVTRITPCYDRHIAKHTDGKGRDTADAVARLIAARERTNAAIDAYVDVKLTIIARLELVEDERYRELLTLRYVDYCSYDAIAVLMRYDLRWVYRLHGCALQAFATVIRH